MKAQHGQELYSAISPALKSYHVDNQPAQKPCYWAFRVYASNPLHLGTVPGVIRLVRNVLGKLV